MTSKSEEQVKESLLFCLFKRNENTWSHDKQYATFYSGFTYNHQELKTNRMPFSCHVKNPNVSRNLFEED